MKTAGPRRPGRLWLLFHGRRRRGFPGLLVGVLAASILLGLVFAIPGGADVSRWLLLLSAGVVALLVAVSLALVLIAWRRPRGGR